MIEAFWMAIAGVSVILAVYGVRALEQIAAALERAYPEPAHSTYIPLRLSDPPAWGLRCVLCEHAFLPLLEDESGERLAERAVDLKWRVSPFTSPPQASTWMCPTCAAGRATP